MLPTFTFANKLLPVLSKSTTAILADFILLPAFSIITLTKDPEPSKTGFKTGVTFPSDPGEPLKPKVTLPGEANDKLTTALPS